jgi:hypothetical protein
MYFCYSINIPSFMLMRIFFLVWIFTPIWLSGQRVTVSDEISVKNNFSYNIFPNLGDRLVFYHDKGQEHNFEIFDQNLRYLSSVDIHFEKKQASQIGLISIDEKINFYYTYRDTGYTMIKVRSLDRNIRNLDTVTLSVKKKRGSESSPKFYFSEDKSKVVILSFVDKMMQVMLVDNRNLKLIYDQEIIIEGFDFKDDFSKLALGDNGHLWILCDKSSFWRKSTLQNPVLINIGEPRQPSKHRLESGDNFISSTFIRYDNLNDRLALGGFVGEDESSQSLGFFAFSIPVNTLYNDIQVPVVAFDAEWMTKSSTGKKVGKAREFDRHKIRELVCRKDGGVLMTTEVVKEFARRISQANPNYNEQYHLRGGQIDYYIEDIVVFANNADGKPQWDQLLFKKQYSQDDDGIYSSHFLFKTAGRLKFLYNDEIKNANTVSEYVVDPLGHVERRSVLSTEYQNLKLRFRDAIQTGPKSIIVPSEKSWKINLVKIEYD